MSERYGHQYALAGVNGGEGAVFLLCSECGSVVSAGQSRLAHDDWHTLVEKTAESLIRQIEKATELQHDDSGEKLNNATQQNMDGDTNAGFGGAVPNESVLETAMSSDSLPPLDTAVEFLMAELRQQGRDWFSAGALRRRLRKFPDPMSTLYSVADVDSCLWAMAAAGKVEHERASRSRVRVYRWLDHRDLLPPDVVQLLKSQVQSKASFDLLVRYGLAEEATWAMGQMLFHRITAGRTQAEEEAENVERINLYRHLIVDHHISGDMRVMLADRDRGVRDLRGAHLLVDHGLSCGWVRGADQPNVKIEAAVPVQQAQDEPVEPDAGPSTPESGESTSGPLTIGVTHDLLLLVQDEFPRQMPDEAEIAGWSLAVREQVAEWAGAVHLAASDNEPVDIPAMPKVLDFVHPGQVSGFRIANAGRKLGKSTGAAQIMDVNVQHHIDLFGWAIEYQGDHPGVTMLLDPTKVTLHGIVAYKEMKELLEYIAKPDGEVDGAYGSMAELHPDKNIEDTDIIARARIILGYEVKPHYPGDGTSELVKKK